MQKRHPHKGVILAIILVSYLMIVLDISITITALPHLKSAFGFSEATLSWVQSAYTLAFGGLLLLGARIGDILGRRKMFMAGIGLFTLASLGVATAQSDVWLLAARAIQGVGAAILAPSTLALISANFAEGKERTRAVAYYGAVAGVGASLGLVLGGIFTTWLSWRVGFFINVPIGIAMLLLTPRYIEESELHKGKFDIAGAITSTIGMTALVYGFVNAAEASWTEASTFVSLALGVLLLAYFVFNEWKADQPIMPLRLFKSAERSGAYISRILFLGAMMGFWFYITQYLQTVKGFTAIEAGLAFLPMTVANFIAAMLVPRLTHKYGNGPLLAGGLAITLLGMIWLSRLTADGSYLLEVALPMLLIGVGQGASLSPLTAAGIVGVTPKDAGAASGLVNAAHQLGGSLGLSILVTVFAAAGSVALAGNKLLVHQISTALMAGSLMLFIALAITVATVRQSRKQLIEES